MTSLRLTQWGKMSKKPNEETRKWILEKYLPKCREGIKAAVEFVKNAPESVSNIDVFDELTMNGPDQEIYWFSINRSLGETNIEVCGFTNFCCGDKDCDADESMLADVLNF